MNEHSTLAKAEAAYLMGDVEPATSSVLISNSKYLNNPLFRDTFAQMGLKRDARDLPDAYLVPALLRAIDEVSDRHRIEALVQAERQRNPEFAAWLDERFISHFTVEMVAGCKPGTLGARVHEFMVNSGLDLDFIHTGEAKTDYDFLTKRSLQYHDIFHMITGFCPSQVGEIALIAANSVINSNYFSKELAHELNLVGTIIMATTITRSGLHYPDTMNALLEGIGRGHALGMKQKKPLFMTRWEDHLDRPTSEIRAEFGFEDGPEEGYWDWVIEAFHG